MSRERRADAFYSRWARVYELIALRTPGIRGIRREAVGRLDPPSGGIVTDMGCATGPNFGYLRDAVGPDGAVVGVDVARGALGRASASIDRSAWDNVHVVAGDATRPPIVRADAVFAGFVLGMFARPADAVSHWCDLLGAGGRIGLLDFVPNDRWYAVAPNLVLRGLILASAPGRVRFRRDAMKLLASRVEAGHDVLEARCTDRVVTTHWGGIVRIHTGTVANT